MLGFVGAMLVLAVGLQFVAKPPKPEHRELLVFDLGLIFIGCGLIGASWTRRRWIGAACGLAVGLAIGGAALLKAGREATDRKEGSRPTASEMEGEAIVEGILRLDEMHLEQLASVRDPATAQRAGERISELTKLRADARQLWEDYCRGASPDLVKRVAAKHESKWQQLDERFRRERTRIEAIPSVRGAASVLCNHERTVP
ncbi:hypothetical protein JCM17478_36740 [Thermopirellula anaerolimosa]